MHHGVAHETATQFTAQTHFASDLQGLLHVRVEIEKTQRADVAAVTHHRLQLATRFEHHLTALHHGFELQGVAVACRAECAQLGFVFVTHGQMQGHVDRAQQAHFAQSFLRHRQWFALGDGA